MAEKITIARPYSKAVFELACDKDELAKWSEMLNLAATVISDEGLRALLTSPKVSKSQLGDVVCEICGDNLDQLGANFIRVLAQNRRLDVLPEIAALFEIRKAEFENTVDVEVTSAVPVDAAQQEKIAASLKKRLGRDVRITCEIDESLIGGAVIRARDLVIDGSVRGRLERLAAEMLH